MLEITTFKNREAFLSFLESISDNTYDNAPVLRNYITRLYYHNDIPVLNKGDLIGSCNRSCTVLSESDTAKYIDKLIEIGFLVLTSEKPTKIFQVDCLDGSSLYLNADFYNPDRFAMGTPSVDHAGEDKKDDSDGGRSEPLHDFLDMFGLSDKSVDDIADGILGANNKDNNK